jgi:hypothetical protein
MTQDVFNSQAACTSAQRVMVSVCMILYICTYACMNQCMIFVPINVYACRYSEKTCEALDIVTHSTQHAQAHSPRQRGGGLGPSHAELPLAPYLSDLPAFGPWPRRCRSFESSLVHAQAPSEQGIMSGLNYILVVVILRAFTADFTEQLQTYEPQYSIMTTKADGVFKLMPLCVNM